MKHGFTQFALFISFLSVVFTQCTLSQTKESFIPPTYSVMDSVILDFDKDKTPDLIMMLESSLQDSLEDDYPRLLIVLRGLDSVNYELNALNDSLLLCKNCGGFFDPYAYTSFDNDTLIITQEGGSIWRWGYLDYCVYESNDNAWYFVKEYYTSYNNLDMEATQKERTEYIHKKLDNRNH